MIISVFVVFKKLRNRSKLFVVAIGILVECFVVAVHPPKQNLGLAVEQSLIRIQQQFVELRTCIIANECVIYIELWNEEIS